MVKEINAIDKAVRKFLNGETTEATYNDMMTSVHKYDSKLPPLVKDGVHGFCETFLKPYATDPRGILTPCLVYVTFEDMKKSFSMHKKDNKVDFNLSMDMGINLLRYLWTDLLNKYRFLYC